MSESLSLSEGSPQHRSRRFILALGAMALVLAGLFPPWVAKIDALVGSGQSWPTTFKAEGCRFIFAPASPEYVREYRPFEGMAVVISHSVDHGRLLITWAVIAAVTAAAYFFVRERPRSTPPRQRPPSENPSADPQAPLSTTASTSPATATPASTGVLQRHTPQCSRRAASTPHAAAGKTTPKQLLNEFQSASILVGMLLLFTWLMACAGKEPVVTAFYVVGLTVALTSLCVYSLRSPALPSVIIEPQERRRVEQQASSWARTSALAGSLGWLVPGLALCGVLCGARAWRSSSGQRRRTGIATSLVGLTAGVLLRLFLAFLSPPDIASAETTAMAHPAALRAVATVLAQATGKLRVDSPWEREAAILGAEQTIRKSGGPSDWLFQGVFKAMLPTLGKEAADRNQRRQMLGALPEDTPERLEFDRLVLAAMRLRDARTFAEERVLGIPLGTITIVADVMTLGLTSVMPSCGAVSSREISQVYKTDNPVAGTTSAAAALGFLALIVLVPLFSSGNGMRRDATPR